MPESLPETASVNSTAWFVVHTKPRQEQIAREQLQRQEFETYLPFFKVLKKPRKRSAAATAGADSTAGLIVREPMFPRYLFLRPTRPTQSLSVVRSTLGVSRLVLFGHQPAMLADNAVQLIRQAESLREEASMGELSPYRPGMVVCVHGTPLDGVQALVQAVSKDRVTLLLEILGRPQSLQLEFGQIRPL